WTVKEIHQAVLTTFALSEKRYRLNQLRYDLRKLKGHGLLERDGSHYAYASPPKAPKSLSCSSSFTSAYADLSPTPASIINPIPKTDPTAGWRLPTIVPMRRSRKSSICSPQLDATALIVGLVLSNKH